MRQETTQFTLKRLLTISLVALCVAALLSVPAFAASGNEYAENLGNWILEGIYWIALIAIIWGLFNAVVSRNMIAAGILLLTGILVIGLIANPDLLKTMSAKAFEIIGLST